MSARNAITFGALAAMGFAAVLVFHRLSSATHAGSVPLGAVRASPSSPAMTTAVEQRAAATPRASRATVEPARPVSEVGQTIGEASGTIHFQRQPGPQQAQGASIDLQVRSAVGVWQPGEGRMRIVLLEAAPSADDVEKLFTALRSSDLAQNDAISGAGKRGAIIELRFIPNAQAFDRNELDSATLIASDGELSSAADALNGLSWNGSLPSPQLQLPAGSRHPTIELTSNGDNIVSDKVTWQQTWRLSLAVPVVMRND